MINTYRIHVSEVFEWVDDFIRVTGVSTYAAMQIYAECCYFEDPNALLSCLIQIEAEYDEKLKNNIPSAGYGDEDYDPDPDPDGEIFLEHYGEYQLPLSTLADEDAVLFAEHYKKVLIHHGFNKQFSTYFVEHFHPLSEYVTSTAPEIDKKFLLRKGYSYTPFFTEPPEAPDYQWLSITERLDREPPVDPAGWITVFQELSFVGLDMSTGPSWAAYEPSFFIGPNAVEAKEFCEEEGVDYDDADLELLLDILDITPIYVTPISISSISDISFDMIELRIEISNETDTAIVLYAAPYILRSPDNKKFISIWGEILDGDTWKIMPLHAGSTSREKILEDSFLNCDGPDWDKIATPDQPLVEIWQKNHISSKTNLSTTSNTEIISLNPNIGDA